MKINLGLFGIEIVKETETLDYSPFQQKNTMVKERPLELNKKSNAEMIELIHGEFFSAGDKLLNEANNLLSNTNVDEKHKMLSEHGFNLTNEAESHREKTLKIEKSKLNIEAISFFKIHYPDHKFISHSDDIKICEKYGLVLGRVDRYQGFVPHKCLLEISDFFKKHPNDNRQYIRNRQNDISNICSKETFETELKKWESRKNDENTRSGYYNHINEDGSGSIEDIEYGKTILNICAPLKDMNTENMEVKNNMLVMNMPDPIVMLNKRHDNGVAGFLIITAWGDEASDELVVNQNNN